MSISAMDRLAPLAVVKDGNVFPQLRFGCRALGDQPLALCLQRRRLGAEFLESVFQQGNGFRIGRGAAFGLLLAVGGLELRQFDLLALVGHGGDLRQQRIEPFGPLGGNCPQGLLQPSGPGRCFRGSSSPGVFRSCKTP